MCASWKCGRVSSRRPVGFLPAAGRGVRFGASGYAKELFPLLFESGLENSALEPRPIGELALRAIEKAGAARAIVVVSPEKLELVRVFGRVFGANENGMALAYAVQPEPGGIPHALACARPWLENEDVVFAMPDTIFLPDDALARAHAERIASGADVMLGVFPTDEPERLGPVELARDGSIVRIHDKPANAFTPKKYVGSRELVTALHDVRLRLGCIARDTRRTRRRIGSCLRSRTHRRPPRARDGVRVRTLSRHRDATRSSRRALRARHGRRPLSGSGRDYKMSRTHLFVAPQSAPFGETVIGMRIAEDLHARGDEIVVFAHESLAILVHGKPFRFVPVPKGARIDEAIASLAREVNAASIVLLDATGVYMMLKREGTDATFLRTVNRRVIGLDVWNLRRTGLEWDLVGSSLQHSRYSLDVNQRLIPVPFAPPTGSKGLYNALPRSCGLDAAEREEIRADFGAREGDRIVFFTSARWQDPASQAHEAGRRLALLFPDLIAQALAKLGPRVHVVHVGPARFAFDDALGDRYTWLPQRSPQRFAKTLASADMLLSFNFSATTIASAIVEGVPVVLGVSSHAGKSADQIASQLDTPRFASISWFERLAAPGLFRSFLTPLARNNPYTGAVDMVEVLDESSFIDAMRRALFDEEARAALIERQVKYRAEVESLPTAADLVETYLAS